MTRISLDEAQAQLAELIAQLSPGEELQITKDDRPVARLVGEPPTTRHPRTPGSAVGQLIIAAEDDEHLADFKEYMP